MSLADRVDVSADFLDELPLAVMVVSLLAVSFFLGALVGAEAIAAGSPTVPPARLAGLVWGGMATDHFLAVYRATTTALWVCAVGVLVTTAVAALRQSE